jgi:hypothetical protein
MKTGIRAIHVAAVLFCIFGLLVASESRKLSYWSEYGPGPGFFPFGLGVSIFILALFILIDELRKRDKAEAAAPFYSGWSRDRKPLLTIAAFAFLMFTVNIVGFYISSSLFIGFLVKVVERKPWWIVLTVTTSAMLFFYLVFDYFLSVQLPQGYFGR